MARYQLDQGAAGIVEIRDGHRNSVPCGSSGEPRVRQRHSASDTSSFVTKTEHVGLELLCLRLVVDEDAGQVDSHWTSGVGRA